MFFLFTLVMFFVFTMIVTEHFDNDRDNTLCHFAEPVVYTVLKESFFDSAHLTEYFIKSSSVFSIFNHF